MRSRSSAPERYPAGVAAVLGVIQVLISFALVALVLMHSGRDTGFGGLGFTPFSHGGQHIVERNLTRLTVVIGTLFAINTIALYYAL
jgi:preprotein translocase subunit SecG